MTQDEILKKVADDHSYDSWGLLMDDCHEPSQIEYTKEAMQSFSSQEITEFKTRLKAELDGHIKALEEKDDGDPWYNGAITELTEFKKKIDSIQ